MGPRQGAVRRYPRARMKLFLIVGSESGNAEMVADCVKDALDALGLEIEVFRSGSLADARLDARELVLIVSSTTGIGDVPQNVEPLYDALCGERPSLAHVRYGVVGLGDRNYKESFLGGPKKWDTIFSALGATRIGERLELDATDNPTPDEDAVRWVRDWIATV
jgi:MioC protein